MEYGWGEFEIGIRIHLHDELIEPVSLRHILKLHHGPNIPHSEKRVSALRWAPDLADHSDSLWYRSTTMNWFSPQYQNQWRSDCCKAQTNFLPMRLTTNMHHISQNLTHQRTWLQWRPAGNLCKVKSQVRRRTDSLDNALTNKTAELEEKLATALASERELLDDIADLGGVP